MAFTNGGSVSRAIDRVRENARRPSAVDSTESGLPNPAERHSPERSALPIASDSHDAKEQVAQFLNVVVYDTVDIGSLSDSWRSQANTPVYCKPYMPEIPKGMSMGDTAAWIFQSPGIPAPAGKIKALIEFAVPVHTGGWFEFFAAG